MSMIPPRAPSSSAEAYWTDFLHSRRDAGLEGKVVSYERLMKSFPEGKTKGRETLGQIEEITDGHLKVYVRPVMSNGKRVLNEYIAYKCENGCGSIVVGPPSFKNEDTIGPHPLAGRRGYDVSCKICYEHLDSVTHVIS